MPGQRAALTLLILIETAAFAYMSETVVFPALITAAALIGSRGLRFYKASQDRQVILSLVAALVFVAKWRVQPHSQPEEAMEYLSPFLHSLGQFLLVLQTAALFLTFDRGVLPINLPWPGVFVMVAAGDVNVLPPQRFAFQLFAVAFVAATALYFAATARATAGIERRPQGPGKLLLVLVFLFVTASVSWGASSALHRYERTLDDLVAKLLNPETGDAGAGFPNRSRLGSIAQRKNDRAADVVLRAYANAEPGYFRGKAYHWLTSVRGPTGSTTQWEEAPEPGDDSDTTRTLEPNSKTGGRNRFLLDPNRPPSDDPGTEVWVDSPQDVYFLPPFATEILSTEDRLRRDYRHVTSGTDAGVLNYRVRSGPAPDPEPFFDLSSSEGSFSRAALTSLPESIRSDEELYRKAREIFGKATSFTDSVSAVEGYFRSNYGYAIGIDPPPDEDPVRWFLRTRPKAHCEYFAQAAALLLRTRGIPTRYMTGFVVAERNEYGDYWLARNEHAHAWCEAWDDRLGWVVVEATPPAGVPSETTAPWHRQLWEFLSTLLGEFRYRFALGGWPWLLRASAAFFTSPAGWIVLALLAAYVAVRLRMRRRTAGSDKVSPLVAELHALLARMDRRLAKSGFVRHAGETLTRFADRVESDLGDLPAADWYRTYAAARYSGHLDPTTATSLRTRFHSLPTPNPTRRPLPAAT